MNKYLCSCGAILTAEEIQRDSGRCFKCEAKKLTIAEKSDYILKRYGMLLWRKTSDCYIMRVWFLEHNKRCKHYFKSKNYEKMIYKAYNFVINKETL